MASVILNDVSVHYPMAQAQRLGLRATVKQLSLGGLIGKGVGGMGVTALDGVNLTLKDGDRLGIIGSNGAGKSTLLKVIGAILPPSGGKVSVCGRISALLSIHLGLDAEATGYDNIRYRARHMGQSEAAIDGCFDDIVAFSELGDYLAVPMKTYSSGMRLRLAFAIATAFRPDVLVLDEWLSAGDAHFQKKASERLEGLIQDSGVFAFASHSRSMLQKFCNRGLVLQHGRVRFYGDIDEALALSPVT